jgi:hypothetical protein
MAAGVLAAIGAFGQAIGGVLDILIGSVLPDLLSDSTQESSSSWLPSYLIVIGAVGVVSGALLGTGAVMMFRRTPLGRILIVAGCVVTVVTGIVAFMVMYAGNMSVYHGSFGIMGGFGGLIGQVFPVTTAVLALVPATGRWLEYVPGRPGSAAYPAPYPGPGAGFPGPGAPYVDPFRPDAPSYAGQPGSGPATPYAGQPRPGQAAPVDGQPGRSAVNPGGFVPPGGIPQPPSAGPMPYSHEPTPFPEVPPQGDAGADQWRRPEN